MVDCQAEGQLGLGGASPCPRSASPGSCRAFDDLSPFNQMLAVCETAAHLDVLVARGSAAVARDDGVEWYRAA